MLGGCQFRSGTSSQTPPTTDAPSSIDAREVDALDSQQIPADWWDTSWTHRRLITIDNSTVTQPLSAFPVLISLVQSANDDLLGATSTDVRFIAADHATVIAYDVDTSSAAGALFWVPVDIPAMPAAAPTLWVYFADTSGAGPAPNPHAVWSTFVSVHHLDATFADSTGNGHTGVPTSASTTPTAADGQIGTALAFDGTDDALPLATTTAYDLANALSASVWIKLTTWQIQWECIVCKGDNAWRIHRGNTTSHADFGTTPAAGGSTANDNLDSSQNVDGGAWHLVSVEYDGAHKTIYVDGGTAQTDSSTAIATSSAQVVIGHNVEAAAPPDRYFLGDIDELRIGSQVRGAAWFDAEYRAATDSTFAQLGAIESLP